MWKKAAIKVLCGKAVAFHDAYMLPAAEGMVEIVGTHQPQTPI